MTIKVIILTVRDVDTRTQRVIILRAALLSLNAPLTAVVDRRNTGHKVQRGKGILEMFGVPQGTGQTVHVMVIHEIIGVDIVIDTTARKLTVQRMSDLEIIPIVVGGIDTLVALVVGAGIQQIGIG